MLTGENLERAQVSVSHPGVKVVKTQAQPGGKYAFAWLEVANTAKPGTVAFSVRTPAGQAPFSFSLARRAPVQGKFAGLSQDDVVYLIMPDRFADGDTSNNTQPNRPGSFDRKAPKGYHGGDLRGIRQRLPYLRDLGVTAIWMTPFWANTDADYHGYHVVDFYDVDGYLGTMRDVQDLVADAHKHGIKIVIDYVVNHIGPRHPWALSPPTATWLHGSPQRHLEPVYKFNGIVDPHAPRRASRGTIEGWFAGRLPDLNTEDPLLATYLLQNAIWWTEMTGLDAYRLDTFPYSSRRFWSGWHEGIFRVYPKTFTIGEVWDGEPTITAFFQGGRKQWDGIDTGATTVFDFPLMMAVRDVVIRGASTQKIVGVLQSDSVYTRPELLVTFIGNHDAKRFISEEGSSPQKLKAGLSLLVTMRGIPQLYAGEEIGLPGGDDPDNRRDFPGGFPGDQRNTFEPAGRTPAEREIFNHVQTLLKLRRENPALRRGRQWHIGQGDSFYAFAREDGKQRILVVYNNSAQASTIKLDFTDTPLANASALKPVYAASPTNVTGNVVTVSVAPQTAAIYEVQVP